MTNTILIGFHRRSGSTLLMNLISSFKTIDVEGEFLSSKALLKSMLRKERPRDDLCLKPVDAFYLYDVPGFDYLNWFDKFVWITRMPMDSYLSEMETGYMYLSYLSKKEKKDIRVKFFERWKRVYKHYFENEDKWHLIKYEDLTMYPKKVLEDLSDHLDLKFDPSAVSLDSLDIRWDGGDTKILETDKIHGKSRFRFKDEMTREQVKLFKDNLGDYIESLGYDVKL